MRGSALDRRHAIATLLGTAIASLFAPRVVKAITIPDVTLSIMSRNLSSHHLDTLSFARSGRKNLQLFRAIPKSAPPPGGFAAIYMLDGNAVFDLLTPELLAQWPDLMIVGVGYAGNKAFDVNERSRDYTPPLQGRTGPSPDPDRPERQVGGYDDFHADLTGPVRELAEQGIVVNGSRRALWGHSLGGVFALTALFAHPESFSKYVPVSPSMWWGDGILAQREKAAVPVKKMSTDIFIMLGDMEHRSGTAAPQEPRPAPDTMALIARLAQRTDISLATKILKGANHNPALRRSIPYALAFAAGAGLMDR